MRNTLLPKIMLVLGALALLAGCRPVTSDVQDAITPTAQSLVTETTNAGDVLTIISADARTIVDIVSPSGIGRAQVQLSTAANPILLRFHLKGLEQAVIDNGRNSLSIAVSSHPPYSVSQTLQTARGAAQLAQGDPQWADVHLVPNGDTPPTIPLPSGYIEVSLPAAFVDVENPSLALQWIDFYR